MDDAVTEGTWFGVHGVVVSWVRHHVVPSVTATNGVATETDAAISQTFSPEVPTLVAAPAVINWIARPTREKIQIPPLRVIPYSPV